MRVLEYYSLLSGLLIRRDRVAILSSTYFFINTESYSNYMKCKRVLIPSTIKTKNYRTGSSSEFEVEFKEIKINKDVDKSDLQ
jgi:hypothetical protein